MVAIPTKMFTQTGGCYVAEASDLRDYLRDYPTETRITLHDDQTGYRRVFSHVETQRDADGDVILWRYVPDGNAYEAIEILND